MNQSTIQNGTSPAQNDPPMSLMKANLCYLVSPIVDEKNEVTASPWGTESDTKVPYNYPPITELVKDLLARSDLVKDARKLLMEALLQMVEKDRLADAEEILFLKSPSTQHATKNVWHPNSRFMTILMNALHEPTSELGKLQDILMTTLEKKDQKQTRLYTALKEIKNAVPEIQGLKMLRMAEKMLPHRPQMDMAAQEMLVTEQAKNTSFNSTMSALESLLGKDFQVAFDKIQDEAYSAALQIHMKTEVVNHDPKENSANYEKLRTLIFDKLKTGYLEQLKSCKEV